MKKLNKVLLVLILGTLIYSFVPKRVFAQSAIPQTILNGLRKGGTALVFYWWDYHIYDPHGFDADLPIIKQKGGGHVRLTISMNTIEQGTSGHVNEARWQDLINFVNLAKSNGLVTIIDIHDTGLEIPGTNEWTDDYMQGLRNSATKARHLSLLTDVAGRIYRDMDRNWVVLQPANEPIFGSDPNVWYNYQNQLIPAIRNACPDCVVFAMANDWQSAESTYYNLNPSNSSWWDARVIADVHFYDPLELTHCNPRPGASDNCGGKTWPGTYSDWDGSHLYNKSYLESKLAQLWQWKSQHNQQIIHFSEIGTGAALVDSVKGPYLADLTSILAAHGASWSCWEWDQNFGMYPNHPLAINACFGGPGGNSVPSSTPTPTQTPHSTVKPTPSSSPHNARPGDTNNDEKVDGLDYLVWINHYGSNTLNGFGQADFNLDNTVDGLDYIIWLNNYDL